MAFGRAVKRQARAAVPPVVFLMLTTYFCWNAVGGDRGISATKLRQEDLRNAVAEQLRAESDLTIWEKRVVSLRASRLDTDALDERARAMLNLSDPGDVIVPMAGKERLF